LDINFGTQNKGKNLVAMTDAEFEVFKQDPYDMCLDLATNERSENLDCDQLKFQKSWIISKLHKKSRFSNDDLYPVVLNF
jgi:hypothetical protein